MRKKIHIIVEVNTEDILEVYDSVDEFISELKTDVEDSFSVDDINLVSILARVEAV